MMKEFYKKALPSTGVYCVATIDPIAKITKHKFVEKSYMPINLNFVLALIFAYIVYSMFYN